MRKTLIDHQIACSQRGEEDIKAGRYTECKTKKESEAFFKKILDE